MTTIINPTKDYVKTIRDAISDKWDDGLAQDYAITSTERYLDGYPDILMIDLIDDFPVAILEASYMKHHFKYKHLYINRLSGIGEGGGKRLITEIKELARRSSLTITVQSSVDSKSFYEKYGFQENILPEKVRNPYLLGWRI